MEGVKETPANFEQCLGSLLKILCKGDEKVNYRPMVELCRIVISRSGDLTMIASVLKWSFNAFSYTLRVTLY